MQQTVEIQSTSVKQTIALGESLATILCEGDWVTLDGELGAGKTHLIRGIAQGMGADGHAVASPTFVLMHEYEPEDLDKPLLIHIDAYRLERPSDLEDLGWKDVESESIIMIEWANKVTAVLPDDRLQITICHQTDSQRLISLTAFGSWADRITKLQTLLLNQTND